MPTTPSAKKRMRQAEKRAERNRARRSRIRSAVKKVRAADDAESAEAALREATAIVDRAVTKGLLHSNKAARLKSQLQRHVNELG